MALDIGLGLMADNLELYVDSIFISQWSLVAAADKENSLSMHHLLPGIKKVARLKKSAV